jgi:hypothetical protein
VTGPVFLMLVIKELNRKNSVSSSIKCILEPFSSEAFLSHGATHLYTKWELTWYLHGFGSSQLFFVVSQLSSLILNLKQEA